ncbi:DUF4834 family protein [Alistipes timonensis]|uniref:DUF4834 domain-containing protein n=1 Tax=Alistipes timonensis JC136 TaxID=1033731 RepID=A0A1H4FW42_9BACT|nr:DUF4834 family protein [Alistipes timonensis]MCR2030664.1 DUF4834 family protein [Alistipes timonensis]SEB00858.1 protein of unknown function [Alistipes timonensis JC136]
MNFFTAIIDSLVGFVQRNPLTTLLIVILALGAPALLKGIALFILYFLMGIVVLAIVLMLVFRWRIYKVRKQMEEQFGEGFGEQTRGGFRQRNSGSPFAERERRGREGEVRVHKTAGTPEKRVSKDVGDYVDFEEEKEQ